MRAVVQRVVSASVEVEGCVVSEIGMGLLVFIGVHGSDTESDANYICRKVLNMRLFPSEKVSQFTLHGFLKGNKPDFHLAMPPQKAKPFYASLVDKFRKVYTADNIKDGVFGAMMKVQLVNDGPVTMHLDSSKQSKNMCETSKMKNNELDEEQ